VQSKKERLILPLTQKKLDKYIIRTYLD